MKKIEIKTCGMTVEAEIYDTPTGRKIIDALPLKGKTRLWGNEVFFNTNIEIPIEEDALLELKPGDLAYWPEGNSFCLFFGATPVSVNDNPRAYSRVNVFGKIFDDPTVLIHVRQGKDIEVRLI